jgi:manganese/zinc/iron transport system substrate-binding protein
VPTLQSRCRFLLNAPLGFTVVVALLSVSLIGCKPNSATTPAGDNVIDATVTTGMVADLVRAIGGKHVRVKQLMGAGIDPHLHQPSVVDIRAISSADIVFYNGLMLEGKMSEILQRSDIRTFAVAEALSAETLGIDPAEHAHPDPHVWMNVDLWRQVADGIRGELTAYDPAHAADFAAAHAELDAQLAALHQYGIEVLAGVPPEKRVLVTSHDAFRYFGTAYGVEVQAIQGISTESEASLNRVLELEDILVERKIAAVFIESSVPKESVETLLRGTKSRGHTVTIGGTLYSDAMGNEGTYEGTYIGMMDHNLSTIARALGCTTVPADGFRGRAAAEAKQE